MPTHMTIFKSLE